VNAVGSSVWGRLLAWLEHDTAPDAYWRLRAQHAKDESAQLKALLAGGAPGADKAFARVACRIRASRILFVPALFSGIALQASRLKLVDYLTEQVRQLRHEGFEADIAEIDTTARIADNADRLAGLLESDHRPTWIVTHSKGGLDFLHTLIAHPEVARFVDGWIAFQSPFMGSPVADVACRSVRARKLSGSALKLIGRDLDLIDDLRTDMRAQYIDEHAAKVATIVRDIPVVCVPTSVGGNPLRSPWRPDWPSVRWMDGLELENDGLVPVNSAVLPGARYAVLDGLAHGEVAARRALSTRKFDHVDLLKALFALALREAGADARVAAA
jgi:hypothetical protein